MTYLTEDEQRRRIRAAALKLERELVKRQQSGKDQHPGRTAVELNDVRQTLEHVGRAEGLEEESIVKDVWSIKWRLA